MKGLCFLLLLLVSCKSKSSDQTATDSSEKPYQVIRLVDHKDYTDIDILIDSTQVTASSLPQISRVAQQSECTGKPCQVINLWTSQQAMELNGAKNKDTTWRATSWPYVCEHYAGKYLVSKNELLVYPLLNNEYQMHGGKKSRAPLDSVYTLR